MRSTLLPLAMLGLMTSGCASHDSTPRMVSTPTAPPPLACRVPCLLPPSLAMERNAWEAAVFSWGADCKALHDDCVTGLD
jgi:hypothetical protein